MSIISNEHTSEKAKRDIDFLLNGTFYSGGWGRFDDPSFYVNPTDNIKRVIEQIDLNNKRVLTVASSGDYILESVLAGANEIVAYDINSIQYYISILKVWAVEVLEYGEFVYFFSDFQNYNFFSVDFFKVILKGKENHPAYYFWKEFATRRKAEFEKSGLILLSQGLSLEPENIAKVVNIIGPERVAQEFRTANLMCVKNAELDVVSYLCAKEKYDELKQRLKEVKISFITSDVINIREKLTTAEKFGSVLLSNIPFYLPAQTFVDIVLNELLPILTDDGNIVYYHQNINIQWLRNKAKDKKFELKGNEIVLDKDYAKNFEALNNTLLAHRRLAKSGLVSIQLKDFSSYNGNPNIKCSKDTVSLIRKK